MCFIPLQSFNYLLITTAAQNCMNLCNVFVIIYPECMGTRILYIHLHISNMFAQATLPARVPEGLRANDSNTK